MPWSKRLESEEEEVPDDILVVMVQPGKERCIRKYFTSFITYLSRHATTSLTPSSSSAYSSRDTKARLLPSASWLPVTLTYNL